MDRATNGLESIRFVSYPINPMLILQGRCYSVTSISQVKKLKVRDMSKVPASNDDLYRYITLNKNALANKIGKKTVSRFWGCFVHTFPFSAFLTGRPRGATWAGLTALI